LAASLVAAAVAMVALGLAANLPRFDAARAGLPAPERSLLGMLHTLAMLGFTAAAVWEIVRGWRDDLVEPRRAARRWVALGIGVYAAIALIVELAVRDRPVGALLPALHVLGIGSVALGLAVLVARRSLAVILGLPEAATGDPVRAGDVPAVPTAATTAVSP